MIPDCEKRNIVSFETFISAHAKDKRAEEEDSDIEGTKDDVPRGKCKSGKFWKSCKTRAKTIIKTKGLQLSFEKRKKMQEEIKLAKQLTRNALEERKRQKEELRERRKANIKRREVNDRKAEIVQVVKNPSKIKKKHLRMIEKRDTLPFSNKRVD